MAGGEGSRLRPLTSNRPKPLVPICNQPIMEHIVRLLKKHGITEIIGTLHYLADEIQEYFGDGSDLDVKMSYSIETTPLGTAGAVKMVEDDLKDGAFVIISGDALTDCDLQKAIKFHKEKKSLATLILYRVSAPLEFGVVITAEDGRIVRFLEKPSWSEVFSDTVNTGIYILEPEVFDLMEKGGNYDWSSDIFPELLAAGKPIYGYVMEEYWCDVGNLTQYREAQEHMLSGQVDLPVVGREIRPKIWVGENTTIDDKANLVAPLCIGSNVKIKKGATIGPYSVIGDNCLVEEGAAVDRSVVWESTYLGVDTRVQSATICSRVTIKRDCQIAEEAVVGDRCLIDVGTRLRPRVKLWPDKTVERGSTVTMSLIWGNRWRGNLFRELGVAGLSNIEITPDFACRLASAYGSTLKPGSTVVTSRDSTRSSRMIKRATIASLLSVGCNVVDLQSLALPVARHFIRDHGAAGGMNVRKLPGNSRVTLVEMFDARGAYLSRNVERKVESNFYREDFHRTDAEDLGIMELATRAIEEYQEDFFKLLPPVESTRRLKIVCDYGYSSLGAFLPVMLAKLGVDVIGLNAFNDAKLAPRSTPEVESHVANLRQIVGSLGYDLGVLFINEGERFVLVDSRGESLSGNHLFAVLCTLLCKTHPNPAIAMTVTAPSRLEESLTAMGAQVIRTKADTRSLMSTALDAGVPFAGDDQGGFIFPALHPGFDAPFSVASLLAMLQTTGLTIAEIAEGLPKFQLAYEQVRSPWERKGHVMRVLSEESQNGDRVELTDGIKIFDQDSWVLILPDAIEPLFHVYAESPNGPESAALAKKYVDKIAELV